ncbi:MAG: MFS transporter [Flavobacteriaceae bacterium]
MTGIPVTTLVAIITFFGGLGGGLVFPIMPALGLDLGIPAFMVGLILASNRIARLFFNLPAGHLFHLLGPRLLLALAMLIETVGMLGFSLALQTSEPALVLLVSRFVHGIGMGFLLVGAQAAVLSYSDRGNRGRKTAAVRIAMNTAVPGGVVVGGLLADLYTNNAAFLSGAAVSFAGGIVALLFLPRPPAKIPETGVAPSAGDAAYGIRALLRSPNLPALASAWCFNMLIFMTVQGVILCTLVLLAQERGISMAGFGPQGTSGLLMAVMMGVAALSAIVMGRAIDAIRYRSTPLIPSLLGLALGFVILGIAQTLPMMLLGAVVTGLSYNSVTMPMMALLGDAAGERQHGPAAATFQLFGDIGGTIGPILGIEMAIRVGLEPLYLSLSVLIALAVFVALWLRGYEKRRFAAETADKTAGDPA